MHYAQVLGALAIAGATHAIPLDRKRDDPSASGARVFTVNQMVTTPGKRIAGPIALAQALGKYAKLGLAPSPELQAAAAAAAGSDDGSVAANPSKYDSEYIESVTIGGTTLQLDFDTGSSDLWVFSSELSAADQSGHNIYTPGDSAQQLEGETWKISYGDGSSASGDVYADTVVVGGTTVTAQAVEAAQTVSSEFQQGQNDGLLGLGFSSINTVTPDQQQTFFDNATPLLDSPLFTVDLKKGEPGSYDFGFIDDSKHTGSITYTAVDNSQGFWGFTTSGYKIGNGALKSESIKSIADTGTSLLLLQDDIVTAYWKTVKGAKNDQQQGGYTFPCTATLPSITLQIGGYAAVVPGSFINYAPIDTTGVTCFGGIQSAGNLGLSIFGDIFLKSQFVVFSNDGPQLGFAPKNL